MVTPGGELNSYSLKVDVDQKSIHWATWRRLNEHCNYSGLLVMKRLTTASHVSVSKFILIVGILM